MKISQIFMGLLIVGVMITGIYSFTNSLASDDGYNINDIEDYSNTFDKTSNISSEINEDWQNIFGENNNSQGIFKESKTAAYLTMAGSALNLLKNMVVLPFTISGEIITSLTTALGLPSWIQSFMIASIMAILIFGLLAAIIKWYV